MSTHEIHDDMVKALRDNAPKYTTVKKWVAEFKRGRQSTEDDPRSGRPKETTSQEQINSVHEAVLADRSTVQNLAETCGISVGSVHSILTDSLHTKKLSTRWVPRKLTVDQKRRRVDTSKELLRLYQQNPDNFLARIVTQDETWVHHFDPECKRQSMHWKHHGSPPPRKYMKTASVKKLMASVFWDTQGVLLIISKKGTLLMGSIMPVYSQN